MLPSLMPVGVLLGNGAVSSLRRGGSQLPIFYGAALGYAALVGLLAFVDVGVAGFAVTAFALGVLSGSAFLAQAHMAELAEARVLGTATGIVNSLGFLVAFVYPWLMGVVMDAVDRPSAADWRYSALAYRGAFGLAAGVLAAALALAWLLARERAPAAAPALVADA